MDMASSGTVHACSPLALHFYAFLFHCNGKLSPVLALRFLQSPQAILSRLQRAEKEIRGK